MSRVSVILPTRNRASTVERALRSVLGQTFRDLNLIVIDDCSEDNTFDVVNSLGDPRLQYVRAERRLGAGGARNVGIACCGTELIAFQDSDDEWTLDKLEKQIPLFDKATDVGIVHSDMVRIYKTGLRQLFESPTIAGAQLVNDGKLLYHACGLGIQTCVIRRQVITAAGLFDETLPALEDLDLFIRLSKISRFSRVPEPLVLYHESEGLSSDRQAQAQAREMLLTKNAGELRSHKRFVAKELAEIHNLRLSKGSGGGS
jgi:glycosyltransferase involved in cell wall biosynthesis